MSKLSELIKAQQEKISKLKFVDINMFGICISVEQSIYDDYHDWKKQQDDLIEQADISPAIGGYYSLLTTPTSLGYTYKVINNFNQERFDLTCYDAW